MLKATRVRLPPDLWDRVTEDAARLSVARTSIIRWAVADFYGQDAARRMVFEAHEKAGEIIDNANRHGKRLRRRARFEATENER